QMRSLKFFSEGRAETRVAIELLLFLHGLVEHWSPHRHVRKRERVSQIHLYAEWLAEHLRYAAAGNQGVEALENVIGRFGLVGARCDRQPRNRPPAFLEEELQQVVLFI